MRKNIFNRSTLTAICLSLVMSACSDSFLDIQPQDKPGSDNFLNNLSSAQELVVASLILGWLKHRCMESDLPRYVTH